jgi:hypothetical protein
VNFHIHDARQVSEDPGAQDLSALFYGPLLMPLAKDMRWLYE